MQKKCYKTIFIDWNGTLCMALFWDHWEKEDPKKAAAFHIIQDFFWGSFDDLINPWMRGKIQAEDFVKKVKKLSGLDTSVLMEGLIESCQKMKFISDEIPQLVSEFRKKGIKVVIATDNMDTFHRWTVPALKIDTIFDGVLSSHQLKALKEDFSEKGESLFFSEYLKTNNLGPGEAILLDDSKKTVEIAQRARLDYYQLEFGIGPVKALKMLLKNL